MFKFKIIALVLLSVAIGAVIIQNRGTVKTQLLFTTIELPLILLLGLTALVSFILGLLVATLVQSRAANKK